VARSDAPIRLLNCGSVVLVAVSVAVSDLR
jgi:hypothetical protein